MQTVERPRFRQDLVAELIEDGSTRFIDVADPDSGHMFRFYEVEYSLACAMDGERDVNGIVKWAEEELGLKPSANEVRSVISTLGDLGYLESGKAAAAAATEPAAAAVAAAPIETPRPAPQAAPARPTPQPAPKAAEPPARPTPPPARPKTPPAGTPVKQAPAAPAFNRWDQPTAMGDADEYLEAGVHAGKRTSTPVADVELGSAGARAAARGGDLPEADDMELGAPGVKPTAAQARKGADVELGNAGAAGINTDLAADMAISVGDVKQAVRASQVMKAADVPPDLAAEAGLEPAKPAAKPEPKPAAKQPEAKQPEAKQPRLQSRADATPPPEKKPVAMPSERPVQPKAPPAPSSGVSPVLLVILVLAVLGGGGFLLYKYVFAKKKGAETGATQPQPTKPQPPVPPPPPPVESTKLAMENTPPEEIKPTAPAKIATIIASDSEVKAGDTIAKLDGFKPSNDKVSSLEKEIAIFKDQLAAAEKARDAATTDLAKKPHETKILGIQKIFADREPKLAAARTELDKFLIKAPAAGKVTAVAKPNTKVTPTDIVATLQREPVLVATFKSAGEAAAGAKVLLAVKGDDAKKLSCTVVSAGADGTKIECPKDAAAEGTEVTFAGVDTSTPTDEGTEPAKEGEPDGSAAPAKGSDAAKEGAPAGAEPAKEGAIAPAQPADKAAAAAQPADKAAAAGPKAVVRPRARPRPAAPAPAEPAADKPAGDKLFPPPSSVPSTTP